MDKEELLRMAGDPRHIPGIYNYCDRWCERCPLTTRCLNFAMELEGGLTDEEKDINNERFWKKISESFQLAFELLQDWAAEEGIDLNSLEVEETQEEREPVHILIPMARRYMVMADEGLKNLEPALEESPAGGVEEPSCLRRVGGPAPEDNTTTLEEALEVIAWYHMFLLPKLDRALNGRREDEAPELEGFPKDSDGSAKIALIAMDRSLGAWGELSNRLEGQRKAITRIVAYLQRMREITEKEFPQARAFIRPGFDESN